MLSPLCNRCCWIRNTERNYARNICQHLCRLILIIGLSWDFSPSFLYLLSQIFSILVTKLICCRVFFIFGLQRRREKMAVRRVGGIIGRMYRLPGSGLVCWRPGLGSPPPSPPPLNYTGSTGLIRQLVKKRKERIEKERQEKRNEISGPSGQSDGVCLWMRNGRKKRGRNVTYRWTTRMGVWASEESGAKEGEGIAGRNASGVRGWEFLIVDDSTASCGVFQHLNNFPFHTRFPFSSFTCFKSFPFSTFAQVNGGGNWLLPLRNRSKRNDRFRKKKKKTRPGALPYCSSMSCGFLRFHGWGKETATR